MALSTSALSSYRVNYLDDAVSKQLVDTLITQQIAALSTSTGAPTDLFIGATGNLLINLNGSNSLKLSNSNSATPTTVFAATNGQGLQLSPNDNNKTMVFGSMVFTETANAQMMVPTKPTLNMMTNLQLTGNEVITGDLLAAGSVVGSSMNILRDFTGARIGFGFRVTDNSNLELVKYDNRTNLTKRIVLFGAGDAAGASNDTYAFDMAVGSNLYNNRLGGGLSLEADPWIQVSASNIAYTFTGNVGIQTSSPNALLTIANSTNFNQISTDPLLITTSSSTPMFVVKNSGFIGVGVSAPSQALDVLGNIKSSGDISSGGAFLTTSDIRVKMDVSEADLDACYSNVMSLPLRQFKWKEGLRPELNNQNTIGWIAQEVKEIIPQAVSVQPKDDIPDFHMVDTDMVVKNLYGCVKAMAKRIEQLEARLA